MRQMSERPSPLNPQPPIIHFNSAWLAMLGVHQIGAPASNALGVCFSLGGSLRHIGISSAWRSLYEFADELHWLSVLVDDDPAALAVPAGSVADSTAPTTLGTGLADDASEWRNVIHAARLIPISPRNSRLIVEAAHPCFLAITAAL